MTATAQEIAVSRAMRVAVDALGGAKQVGAMLWPDKAISLAEIRVLDCLSTDRPAKFSLGEMISILSTAREAGCHEAMYAFCQACGYPKPRPERADEGMDTQSIPQILNAILSVSTDMRDTMEAFKEAAVGSGMIKGRK